MTPAEHPGHYIKREIVPIGMSVSEVAKRVDMSRPAVSNLLNAKVELSIEFAKKIEAVFGYSAKSLMYMMATHKVSLSKSEQTTDKTQNYVPKFLSITGNHISNWAQEREARTRFPVLLRTLVNSTGSELSVVDFPGNDDGERPGWDGVVVAGACTPKVPYGKSCWEFGCTKDFKRKAESDYSKRTAHTARKDKDKTVYICVTPHRWPDKKAWAEEKRQEAHWKDVIVYDSSDLEQWLELSIVGQVWLANEIGNPTDGVKSIDQVWTEWLADCDPVLTESLFDQAFETHVNTITKWIEKPAPANLVVAADSVEEASAFICVVLRRLRDKGALIDRSAFFENPASLKKVITSNTNIIPIISKNDVERAFSIFASNVKSIILYPRNATNRDHDVLLEPLSYECFRSGLEKMGCNDDQITKLSNESGRSLTILRRRLSKLNAVKTPRWSADTAQAHRLVPIALAGSWNQQNQADQFLLEMLSGGSSYDNIEKDLALLLKLDDTPVWSVGSLRGAISKIDAIFAIKEVITPKDVEQFFQVAELVLSEDDPALDLPEDERWAASMHGKTRELSGAIREGISSMLVLLAVFSKQLFGARITNVEADAEHLVRRLLNPFTLRTLESQDRDLPVYAETAPNIFLDLVESDLNEEQSEVLKLLRLAGTGFGSSCPRTGLLWALELLAWSSEFYPRIVLILAELSKVEIDDNWSNTPMNSLHSLFRHWYPQTAANLCERKSALDLLFERHTSIAWNICIFQISSGVDSASPNMKPTWRSFAHGVDGRTTNHDSYDFLLYCVDLLLKWPSYGLENVIQLLDCLEALSDDYREKVLTIIEEWIIKNPSEKDKATLREKIRVSTYSRRAVVRAAKEKKVGISKNSRMRSIYESLAPEDIVINHSWLFKDYWVVETVDEYEDDAFDHIAREKRIKSQRLTALHEIWKEQSLIGIIRLAKDRESAGLIGDLLRSDVLSATEIQHAIIALISDESDDEGKIDWLITGMLSRLKTKEREAAFEHFKIKDLHAALLRFLLLSPFDHITWTQVEQTKPEIETDFWNEVNPRVFNDTEFLQTALYRLLKSGRPIAAFHAASRRMKTISAGLIKQILDELLSTKEDVSANNLPRPYDISKAFSHIGDSGGISEEVQAGLEFRYLSFLDRSKHGIPNLESQIHKSPAMFVDAVRYSNKRADGIDDTEKINITDEARNNHISATYKLLGNLKKIPGTNKDGEFNSKDLIAWIKQVQAGCKAISRLGPGDSSIGKLLSNAPKDENGNWPCEAVRDALEALASERMISGFTIGKYNSRGAQWSGEGGNQEREMAKEYKDWSAAVRYTHPKVSRVLSDMAESYQRDAEDHDNEAAVRRRTLR